MRRAAALTGLALMVCSPALAETEPGYVPELQEGGWILLRHEDPENISYLLQADSRDGGVKAEMVCSANLQGEKPPVLVLLGKGSGKAELATLGPAATSGELEITDGKAPQPLWQAPASLGGANGDAGSLNANLADLRGLRMFLSAARETKLSLVLHADFKKRDLRSVYETPPPSITARLLERCDGLRQWVSSHQPPPPPPPPQETPAPDAAPPQTATVPTVTETSPTAPVAPATATTPVAPVVPVAPVAPVATPHPQP